MKSCEICDHARLYDIDEHTIEFGGCDLVEADEIYGPDYANECDYYMSIFDEWE